MGLDKKGRRLAYPADDHSTIQQMTGRYLLTILLFTLSCCGRPQPEDLPPFPVEIDTARDTILHTPNGALIHISPHALTAGNASRVRLIIRQNEDFIDLEAPKGQPM